MGFLWAWVSPAGAQGRATCLHELVNHPLECLGAEPFFILTIAGARAEFARLGRPVETWYAADCRYGEDHEGDLDRSLWRLPLRDLDSTRRGEALVRQGISCDIGYQDTSFDGALELTTPDGQRITGCCQLRPDIGKETLPNEHPSQ